MGVERVKHFYFLFAFLFATIPFAVTQDSSMPGMPGMKPEPAPAQQQPKDPQPRSEHDMQNMPGMQGEAEQPVHMMSGTHLEPASTPAPMWMKQAGPWMLMVHGSLFLTGNF